MPIKHSNIKRVSILHLIHQLAGGGAERVLLNLINNSSEKFDHIIGSFKKPTTFQNELHNKRCKVIYLNKRDGNDFLVIFKIKSICDRHAIKIIQSWGWASYIEGLIASKVLSKRIKYIFSFRGKTLSDLKGIPVRRRLIQRFCAPLCDGIITPSFLMKDDYSKSNKINSKRISVIYNGVDVEKIDRPFAKSEIKTSLDYEDDDFIIGCIARFDPVKNLFLLLDAFYRCKKKYKKLKMIIIGDGQMMGNIKEKISKLNLDTSVYLPGWRSDVEKFLQIFDIYVQPSYYEGISNTILEAMAANLPVIATNVGGTSEVVVNNETGILIKSNNTAELQNALERLIFNYELRRSMGMAGRARVNKLFSLTRMCEAYEEYFSVILGN